MTIEELREAVRDNGLVAVDDEGAMIPTRDALRRAASQLTDEQKREEVPYLLESLRWLQSEGLTEHAREMLSFYRECGFPLPDSLPALEPESLLGSLLAMIPEPYRGLSQDTLWKISLYEMTSQNGGNA